MTPAVLVVADDLTGGNSVAAGFARAGMRAVNVVASDAFAGQDLGQVDVLVVTSETRHCSPAEAVELTRRAAGLVVARLTGIRIDSTLRGNIAPVVETVLGSRRGGARRAVALCVPAHPPAGRQTRDGVQLLGGVPLEQTGLAADPLNPVSSSDALAAATLGSGLSAEPLPIDVVTGPADALRTALRRLAERCDVIVADAMTEEDLARIASAAGALASEVDWVPVDPGPFTVQLAGELGMIAPAVQDRILVVSASASELTRAQLRELGSGSTTVLMPLGDTPLNDADAAQIAARVRGAADGSGIVVLASAIDEAHLIEVDAERSARIVSDFGVVVRHAMQDRRFAGLYCTGGDLAAEVVRALDAVAIDAVDEVVPLAVLGTLIGGPWSGHPIVTKGGQVGTADTAVECIRRLRQHLRQDRGGSAAPQTRATRETRIGREGK